MFCRHCWVDRKEDGEFKVPMLCKHGYVKEWKTWLVYIERCHKCGKHRWFYPFGFSVKYLSDKQVKMMKPVRGEADR